MAINGSPAGMRRPAALGLALVAMVAMVAMAVISNDGMSRGVVLAATGGVAWHSDQGWSYVAPQSLPAPANFPGTLDKMSAAIKRSENSLAASIGVGHFVDPQKHADAGRADGVTSGESDAGSEAVTPGTSKSRSLPAVTDEDYKRDVLRGVLSKHTGFPDLPDCPTDGLWGGYRAGFAPGQKRGAGNCQDYSLRSTGVPANDLQPKLGFDVKSWDTLWKQDLKGLQKARSYAKLTKGLWSDVAPDATMAYYMPNSYRGSLAEYYQEPRGEATATQNNAHNNGIVPVPGHKGPYYSSDFTRGEASPAPPPVTRVYGNRPGTLESNSLHPITQGLYSGPHLQSSLRAAPGAPGGSGLSQMTAEERSVVRSLRRLNDRERRRLSAVRGIGRRERTPHVDDAPTSALATSGSAVPARGRLGRGRRAMKNERQRQESLSLARARAYRPLTETTTRELSQAYTRVAEPPTQTAGAVVGDAGGDDADAQEDKAQLALKHYRHLRKKLYRWRKYFRANVYDGKRTLDTGLPPVAATEDGDPDAYFWCYSHYGDLSPDKLNGEYPDFEECLHVLGGAKWGAREGGDEALAYGDVVKPRPGVVNTMKKRRGFGDGFVAASSADPDEWKFFQASDEEFGGETRNQAVVKREGPAAWQAEDGDEGAGDGNGEQAGLDGLVVGLKMALQTDQHLRAGAAGGA